MRFDLLTIFPEIFDSYLNESIIKRAILDKKLEIAVHDIRKFSKDRHHKVDSTPYGGGPGMVMAPQPIYDCIQYVKTLNNGPVLYLSPRGKMLTQRYAEKLYQKYLVENPNHKEKSRKNLNKRENRSLFKKDPLQGKNKILTAAYSSIREDQNFIFDAGRDPFSTGFGKKGIILLCGRYEGIDQRVIDLAVDEELSIGKYILTGGELGALVVVDVISRLIPGVLGDDESNQEESFSPLLNGKKEYPHYTRPEVFMGKKVPDVLLSGHHAKIKEWRLKNTR